MDYPGTGFHTFTVRITIATPKKKEAPARPRWSMTRRLRKIRDGLLGASPARDFDLHAKNWSQLAKESPFWSILSQPGSQGAEFDPEGFFRSGWDFVKWLERHLNSLSLTPNKTRALDFGCGLGRLTQSLPEVFDEVHGLDIALPMIEGARHYNKHGDRCHYHHNTRPDLQIIPDGCMDFVLSVLVLQHMQPRFTLAYLREFARVLRPGGLGFFQLSVGAIVPLPGASEPDASSSGSGTLDSCEVRLQIRPHNLRVQPSVIRDVQVTVTNQSGGPLPALQIRTQMLEAATGRPVPDTQTETECPASLTPRLCVVPVQAPPDEGSYELEASVACPDSDITVSVDAPRAAVHVGRFTAAKSSADPQTAWRAAEIRDETNTAMGTISVYDVPIEEVTEALTQSGLAIVHHEEDDWAGPDHISCHFTVRKPG